MKRRGRQAKKSRGILGVVLTLIVIGAIYNLVTADVSPDSVGARIASQTLAAYQHETISPAPIVTDTLTATPTAVRITQTPTTKATAKPTAMPTPTPTYTALERGDKGEDVEALQDRLNALGFSVGTADGIYGGKTETAIKNFQKQAGFTSTGKADSNTLAALWASSTPTSPPKITATPTQNAKNSDVNYILNKNTKKFHVPSCRYVDEMKESNKIYFSGTRQQAIDKGYVPCKVCKP